MAAVDPYIRRCRFTGNYDGDTLSATIDLGWNVYHDGTSNVRVLHIDCPELHASDPATKALALQAKAFTAQWVVDHAAHSTTPPWPFWLESHAIDLYGRALAVITCGQGHNLADDLTAAGLAKPYEGTGPRPWPP